MDIAQYIRMTPPQGSKADGATYYRCPFCGKDKRFEVNPTNTLWYCHKCGIGGRLDWRSLARQEGESPRLGDPTKTINFDCFQRANPNCKAWKYLRHTRGIPARLIKVLDPHCGPSRRMVYLPVRLPTSGVPVYFVSRSILPSRRGVAKYLYPKLEEMPLRKSQVIWGMDRVRCGLENLVICEGILDAIWRDNRVALLGSSISFDQIHLIKMIEPQEITMLLDGDAHPAAIQVMRKLRLGGYPGRVFVSRLPAKEDPDDLEDKGDHYVEERERIL